MVNVFVSDLLPTETPERWAELLVGLTHGPELARVTARIATLAEVQELCGEQALGCYARGEMISPGEAPLPQSTPEEVLRHEYGHHVASNRANAPWRAATWGPKNWASTVNVCARVVRGEAYPGDHDRFYRQNPGEAWAEVYRLMDERRAGITTATWPIISRSFFPNEAALAAAEKDVVAPWVANRTQVFRRAFERANRTWWIRLQTPLDGELSLSATLPRNGVHDVALVASDRRKVIRRAQSMAPRVKRTALTVCGRRSLFVRVIVGAPGRVTLTVSAP